MARVRSIASAELPPDLAEIYERFADGCGPFRNQVAVFAHVPAAMHHLMSMLKELRAAATLTKRYVEIAVVVVSQLNECQCIARHKPFLAVISDGTDFKPSNHPLRMVERDAMVEE